MRLYLFGPRLFGFIRPGVSFSPRWPLAQYRNNKIKGSFVYVIHSENGLVKVGITTNPAARISQLQLASVTPLSFSFIGCTPGKGFDIEKLAHSALAFYRRGGEWFDVSPELAIAAVTAAADRLKQPLLVTDEQTASKAIRIAACGGRGDRLGLLRFITWLAVCAAIFDGLWKLFS